MMAIGRSYSRVRHSWPSARPLCAVLAIGTVLPALPAAAEISLVGIAFAQRVGRGGDAKLIGWQGSLALAALLFPLLAACAYLIARSWTAAAWLAAESSVGRSATWRLGFAAGHHSWRLWLRYLAGVFVLCLMAGLIADLVPDYRPPLAILVAAGPLGLLSPLVLSVSAQVAHRDGRIPVGMAQRPTNAVQEPASIAQGPTSTADVWGVVLVMLIFELGVGAALAPAVLSGSWQVTAGLLAAFLLAVPAAAVLTVVGNSRYHEGNSPASNRS